MAQSIRQALAATADRVGGADEVGFVVEPELEYYSCLPLGVATKSQDPPCH